MSEDWDEDIGSTPIQSVTFNKVESDVSVFNGNTNTSSGDGFGGWNDGESSGDTQFGGGFSESKRGGGFGRGRGRGRGRGGFGQNNSEDYSSRNGGFGNSTSDGDSWGSKPNSGFGGSKFGSSSRNFESSNGNDGWGNESGGGFGESSGFGESFGFGSHSEDNEGGFRGRGRGGRGGRGRGGGGRGGGFRQGRDDNSELSSLYQSPSIDVSGEFDPSESTEPAKPRENYIPPAPPEDEESIFATLQAGINFDKYDEIPVEVTGRGSTDYQAIMSFDNADLYQTLKDNISKSNYQKPTPIQKYALPIILGSRDVMACAQTGSGKTASFLLPVITSMIRDNFTGSGPGDVQTPATIIVAPTRELVLQIYHEARKFSHGTVIRPVVVYGGTSVRHQLDTLERGCHIVVGTPGRLLDFIERGKISLSQVKFVILDEADRMLDMGFVPSVRKLVEELGMPDKSQRQTLMFSATFPEEIQRLASDFLNDYLFITVGRVGGATTDITQKVMEVTEYDKREKLSEILNSSGTDRVLVFVETKRNADFLASYLSQEGFPTTSIHGDRLQREREEALRDFRTGRAPVLVATAVAARGLDIPNVKHVINYDLPQSADEYVHRIGRTGRLGNQGLATAFYDSGKDQQLARSLVKILADAEQDVPEFLEQAAEKAYGSSYGPVGGQFGSTDTRKGYKGGNKPYGERFQNDNSSFGTGFGDSSTVSGGLGSGGHEEEDWN